MAETLKVGLKLKIFASSLMLANFLSKLLHPGVQKKRKKLGGRSAPTPSPPLGLKRSKIRWVNCVFVLQSLSNAPPQSYSCNLVHHHHYHWYCSHDKFALWEVGRQSKTKQSFNIRPTSPKLKQCSLSRTLQWESENVMRSKFLSPIFPTDMNLDVKSSKWVWEQDCRLFTHI